MKPVGDALSGGGFLGGSFAAFIALVLFDAITGEGPTQSFAASAIRSFDQLRESAARAFDAREVRIDFFGFTSETLVDIVWPFMWPEEGKSFPWRRVSMRIMVPDLASQINLPCRVDPALGVTPDSGPQLVFVDDPDFRREMLNKLEQMKAKLEEVKNRIERHAPGKTVDISVRVAPHLTPQMKLFIFNDEACHGYYLVEPELMTIDGVARQVLNPKGFSVGGMILVSKHRDLAEFERHQRWFDQHWNLVE
ncbi:hypothetical protein PV318_01760 [Streptomyces sp. ME02-6991-2B]|nr:hypothetical protein [Streptomyces sp. ME02-6991-2B]